MVLGALALLAAACGGGSDSSNVATSDGDSSAQDEQQNEQEGDESDEDSEPSESPLADLIGIPFTDEEAMEDFFNDLSRQAEAQIAQCMLTQGFEYTPVDYSALSDAGNIDFDTREFAEDYGFGIASDPFEEVFEASEQSFQDPNQDYLETLSPGELDAYQTALAGEIDFGAGDDFNFEPQGCQGDAYNELFSFIGVFEEFDSEFADLEAAYDADPRIVEASSGWAACMSEAGYNFADADGAESDIQRRFDAIVADPGAFEAPELPDDGEDASGPVFFGPGTLTPEFQVQVDELAVEERAVATASWDCNEPLREIEEGIQLEYETRFVDENGDAIRAALAE